VELIDSYPGLLDCLTNGEEEDVIHVGEMVSSLSCNAIIVIVLLDG
jgi:hypothetical protein